MSTHISAHLYVHDNTPVRHDRVVDSPTGAYTAFTFGGFSDGSVLTLSVPDSELPRYAEHVLMALLAAGIPTIQLPRIPLALVPDSPTAS
jgi:translation elongation factor EF-Tu-like GTPase